MIPRELIKSTDPSEFSGKRWLPWYLAIVSLVWRWNFLRFDLAGGFYYTLDYPHQLALLSWMHRSIFEGAGSIFSPEFFYPQQGVLGTSEAPVLFGLIFGIFRELSAGPILAWNLTFGIAVASAPLAMYLAARREGTSRLAGYFAAIFYAISPWLGGVFGEGIWYRAAFGPPLVWYFMTRLKREGARPHLIVGMALVLVAQFSTCMTYAVLCLLLIALRVLLDPGIRTKANWAACALASLPLVAIGIGWKILTAPVISEMGFRLSPGGLAEKVRCRIDATQLLAPRGIILPSAQDNLSWPRYCGTSGLLQWPIWIALILIGLYLVKVVGSRRAADADAMPKNRALVIVWLAGLAIIAAGTARMAYHVGPFAPYAPRIIALSLLAWSGAILGFGYLRSWPPARTIWNDDFLRTCLLISIIVVLLGLGPMIFVFGRPFFIGPLAIVDWIVPGLERLRSPPKFLILLSLILALLSALAFDAVAGRRNARRTWLAALAALPLLGIATGYAHVGGYPFATIRYDKAACPECETNRVTVLPEPYQWLKEHAPDEPLAELPLGLGPLPPPGAPLPESDDPYYMIFHALDAIPRINGVTSFTPPAYNRLERTLNAFPAPAALDALRARGARWVLVHGNRYEPSEWQALSARLDPPPPGLRLKRKWGSVWLLEVE